MDKKRLLKDLPFGDLKAGDVLTKGNGYHIEKGDTIYEEGGKSHNGILPFDEKENRVIDLIWDDDEWFEDSLLEHVNIKANTNKIIISFEPLDMEQAQTFAHGIVSCLEKYGEEEECHSWDAYKGFTISLS